MNRRFVLLWLMAALLVIAGARATPATAARSGAHISIRRHLPALAKGASSYVPGQVIVRLAANTLSINAINLAYGTGTLATLYNHTDTFLLRLPRLLRPALLLQLLSLDPRVAFVELNTIVQSPYDGSTDRIYGWSTDPSPLDTQDASGLMQLEAVHALNQGAGAVVAVLDTGVQLNHPGLDGALAANGFDFVAYDLVPADQAEGLDEDGDGRRDEAYGHGTHVSGIVHLIAPEARIMPVRVLNSDGRGNAFQAANAILYAAVNGADVINLSLSAAQPSLLLHVTVAEAASLGALVVAAAGNLNNNAAQYPAADACALAITAVDANRRKASFASFGPWVSAAAPGVAIYSSVPTSGYAWWSGTSMAAPFAAGQAALLRSLAPDASLDDLARLIGGTAQSLDADNPGQAQLLGAGLINPLASLQALLAGEIPAQDHNLLADC
jgi:thermitase